MKYATSTFFYIKLDSGREGALNAARSKVVSNVALREGGLKINLPNYIQSKPLMPKQWSPILPDPHGDPALAKKSKNERAWLGDKVGFPHPGYIF